MSDTRWQSFSEGASQQGWTFSMLDTLPPFIVRIVMVKMVTVKNRLNVQINFLHKKRQRTVKQISRSSFYNRMAWNTPENHVYMWERSWWKRTPGTIQMQRLHDELPNPTTHMRRLYTHLLSITSHTNHQNRYVCDILWQ